MKVIDSDIFIDALRGVEKAEVFLRKAIDSNEGAFSAITESELLSGQECDEKEKREALLHLLSMLIKISVDNPVAQIAGDLRRQHGLLLPDAIIAATALYSDSILVTRNSKDFSSVKGLELEVPYR